MGFYTDLFMQASLPLVACRFTIFTGYMQVGLDILSEPTLQSTVSTWRSRSHHGEIALPRCKELGKMAWFFSTLEMTERRERANAAYLGMVPIVGIYLMHQKRN